MNIVARVLSAAVVAVACASAAGPAVAAYPDHPIKMIVGWSAGGTDVAARVVAKYMSKQLNVPIVIENRDGASGMIATELVANAPPDGYTIQYTVADTHSINPYLFPTIRYDPVKDFVPIAVVGYNPNVLIVNTALGIDNLGDLLAKARANPGKITFGTWGIGSGGHVRMAALSAATGVEFLHVPFKGSAPALQAVIAGQVDAMIIPAALAKPHAQSGKVRMLAVETEERYELVPDVKTFVEQGLPLNLHFWHGLFAPKGTPQAIAERLNKAMTDGLAEPEAKQDLARIGVERVFVGDGAVAAKTYLDAEHLRWGKIIRDAHITAQ